MATLDRVRGMMIGVAVGDALGAPHEFRYMRNEYTGVLEYPINLQFRFGQRYNYPIGSMTDDTEMTLTLTRSIVENKGYNEEKTTLAYLGWVNAGTHMLGTNTRALFHKIKTLSGYRGRYSKIYGPGTNSDTWSQSNGSLMRATPLALLPGTDHIITDCKLSNPSPINIECSLVYVQAVRLALQGMDRTEIFNTVAGMVKLRPVYDTLLQVLNREPRNITEKKGWVLHAFYTAFYSLAYSKSYQEGIDYVIRLGGDTDTNAAITGGLLGALFGYDKLRAEERTFGNIQKVLHIVPGTEDEVRPFEYTLHDFDTLTERMWNLTRSS